MMTMATPSSAVRTTLELPCLSCVRVLHWEGLRLHWLLCCCCCCCLRILLTSDLNSSASCAGSQEDACSVVVMYASMEGYLGVMV